MNLLLATLWLGVAIWCWFRHQQPERDQPVSVLFLALAGLMALWNVVHFWRRRVLRNSRRRREKAAARL
jgi:type VI protein secretion system component VasK